VKEQCKGIEQKFTRQFVTLYGGNFNAYHRKSPDGHQEEGNTYPSDVIGLRTMIFIISCKRCANKRFSFLIWQEYISSQAQVALTIQCLHPNVRPQRSAPFVRIFEHIDQFTFSS